MKLKPFTQIEASSSCDPFDLLYEKKYGITRKCCKNIFSKRDDILFTWISKSEYIGECVDLLPKLSVPQITIESTRTHITSPNASTYTKRLGALDILADAGFDVGGRIDPIIPGFTSMEEIFQIIEDVTNFGSKHITVSVLKMNKEQITSLEKHFGVNFHGKIELHPINNKMYYFKPEIRKEIEEQIRDKCNEKGITFGTCMEYVVEDTGFCDPFHLLKNKTPKDIYVEGRKNITENILRPTDNYGRKVTDVGE
jgi:DNA repair photolyase